MRLIFLDQAEPGDELALPVLNKRGLTILPKGASLTVSLIKRLRRMGVMEVAVEGHDPNAPPPKTRDELLADLEARFEGLGENALMMEIKRIARQHLMAGGEV